MTNLHPEIDRLLKMVEGSYSLTVPKSIDPTNEALEIVSEINVQCVCGLQALRGRQGNGRKKGRDKNK